MLQELLALSGLFLTGTYAYANPGSCSGACNVHDPSAIQRSSDGKYFRFSTGNLISYASASSIEGPWTAVGSVISGSSIINLAGNDDLWAPDVHLVGSEYICYYSVSTFGSQNSAIGYATSTTMNAGSWTDHGSTGITSSTGSAYNAIDPALLPDGAGWYMSFGSFWDDIYQVELKSSATTASGTPWNIAFDNDATHDIEGSFIYPHGSYYYLFFSQGQCCGYDTSKPAAGGEYKIRVCRSTSATGGFVDESGTSCLEGGGTIIYGSFGTVYGPGGQSIYKDTSLGDVIVYHYVDTTIGYADSQKLFGWNVIDWSSGWPVLT